MIRCANCGGPHHPATGHAFTATTVLCGPCAGRFWAWVVRHTARRYGAAASFYTHAATSVRAASC